MTRFTETDKWRDPWFRSLKPPQKLLFLFIIDNCNNAGFWEEDKDYACYCTNMNEQQYSGALEGLTRGLVGADGWYWVKNFLKHQRNSDLNPRNNAHSQILRLIKEQSSRFSSVPDFSLFLAPYEGLLSPTVKYSNVKSGKEEEAQEEKPRKKKEALKVEIPENLNTPQFLDAWEKWRAYRMERKLKWYVPSSEEHQLQKLSQIGESRAISAIKYSIAQQYQGIFEESRNGNHSRTAQNPNGRLIGSFNEGTKYSDD